MELFYLGSRGIEREIATRMIVGGFVEKTLKLVPADLTERIRSFVAQRLDGLKV
jgi:Fe-S cluster assembly scaffold protein SufB